MESLSRRTYAETAMRQVDPGHPLVLVVDDDPFSLMAVVEVLASAGILTAEAGDGAAARARIAIAPPDIIILDVNLPDIDGFRLCRHLKSDQRTADIPVLFMTSRDSVDDCVAGFAAGGEDYVTKPFRREELVARVRTHIRLHDALKALDRLRRQALDANALTHLPGNATIESAIEQALGKSEEQMVVYADLDNFKAFNDRYGFSMGDRLLRFTADVLCRHAEAVESGFVGNVGGDDFVIVVPESAASAVAAGIIADFDAGVSSFYDPGDVAAGGISTVDRKGTPDFFPIAAISLAGIPLRRDRFAHVAEVSGVCAELKKNAKKISGSTFVVDQRRV